MRRWAVSDVSDWKIHTWADAFGNWHASVETRVDDEPTTRKMARMAILAELRVREGDKVDAKRLRVKQVDMVVHGATTGPSCPDPVVSRDYEEAWQGEGS
jgi:hypothetical protein